jgi:hypothetical protein
MKADRTPAQTSLIGMALGMLTAFALNPAQAADGCKFLLCIAGPWTRIAECRPTVHEVFHDLARGRPMPSCSMSGAANTAKNLWMNDATCLSMYRLYDNEGLYSGCQYAGNISVSINGAAWSQIFWDISGNTSTFYTDAAKSIMTQQPGTAPLDNRFTNDVNSWNSSHVSQCTSAGGTIVFGEFGAFQSCSHPNSGNNSSGG